MKPGDLDLAKEFFQLFKTPWELYTPGEQYDIVLSTIAAVPETLPRVLIVYGSIPTPLDRNLRAEPVPRHGDICLNYSGSSIPLYGSALSFAHGDAYTASLTCGESTIGLSFDLDQTKVFRVGYDLFHEIAFLLSTGQPTKHSRSPTLERHIGILRDSIIASGVPFLEIPASPSGHLFAVCLTHDIDFVGIRSHKFDRTMWGFLWRSTVGGLRRWISGRITLLHLFKMWRAAISLPLVYLGICRDYWLPFEWYLRVEDGLEATYFLIPYRDQPGTKLDPSFAAPRATKYDVAEVGEWLQLAIAKGHEVALHGIDAWHSTDAARTEAAKVAISSGSPVVGVRIHWLIRNAETPTALDQAGLRYDSTAGYNDAIGYYNGTTQVFRPLGAKRLLELPLHIQDGALFLPTRLDFPEAEAWKECELLIETVEAIGGVLTVLWHDRSHGPERFWGDFYIRLLSRLRSRGPWFASASKIVSWFQSRRDVQFEAVTHGGAARTISVTLGQRVTPPLIIRIFNTASAHDQPRRPGFVDFTWYGDTGIAFDPVTGGLHSS